MISFNIFELFSSVFLAVVYGFLAFAFYIVFRSLIGVFSFLPDILFEILNFEHFLKPIKIKLVSKIETENPCLDFFGILLFFIGFSLVSYLALDGLFRLYMLCLALLSFCISNRLLSRSVCALFSFLLNLLLSLIAYCFRAIIIPFFRIFKRKKAKSSIK